MVINISLPEETEQKILERAARKGQSVESFVGELIRRGVEQPPSMDEILAPFRAQVAESGLSDQQITELFTTARDEVNGSTREG